MGSLKLLRSRSGTERPVLILSARDGVEKNRVRVSKGYYRIHGDVASGALARHYDLARHDPDIYIRDVDLEDDRRLVLSHTVHEGVVLDEAGAKSMLEQLNELWRYGIRLEEIDAAQRSFAEDDPPAAELQ